RPAGRAALHHQGHPGLETGPPERPVVVRSATNGQESDSRHGRRHAVGRRRRRCCDCLDPGWGAPCEGALEPGGHRAASLPHDAGGSRGRLISGDHRDRALVERQLGRTVRAFRRVVVRCPFGNPAVTEQAPYTDAGDPFPTTYYLTCRHLVAAVSRLEAAGGVERWSAAVELDRELAESLVWATEEQRRGAPPLARPPTGGGGRPPPRRRRRR